MRKILIVISLVLILAIPFVFVGCGGNSSKDEIVFAIEPVMELMGEGWVDIRWQSIVSTIRNDGVGLRFIYIYSSCS